MEDYELEQHTVTVAQLIQKLKTMPHDARVMAIYDGFCTVDPDHVWLARDGKRVILIDANAPCYHDDDRPDWAPTEKADHNWYTPEVPLGRAE